MWSIVEVYEGGGNMISAVLAVIIVNVGQKLFMRFIGADMMFFSWKKKIKAYIIVGGLLYLLIGM